MNYFVWIQKKCSTNKSHFTIYHQLIFSKKKMYMFLLNLHREFLYLGETELHVDNR